MSREDDFATRMEADATLMAILTGGVHTSGEVGPLGITRETVPGAWDASGYLEPVALVRQRDEIPDGIVRDPVAQDASMTQVVEIWLYEDRGYTNIDLAIPEIYRLFQGHQFADSAETVWVNMIGRQRDEGALAGSSLARLDFAVYSIRSV